MSGGKGGSQTSQQQIPDWVEGPASRNLERAESVADIGYVPFYGPSVAAFTPMQNSAFGNTNNAAQAFGMQSAAPPQMAPTDFGNGMMGYSSGDMYDMALEELRKRRPGQFDAINSMFVDPITGHMAGAQQAQEPQNIWDYLTKEERRRRDDQNYHPIHGFQGGGR